MERADVVVVGGGPAGSITALQLARVGRKVWMVERGDFARPRVGALLPAEARWILADLGLSSVLEPPVAVPSGGVRSAWGTDDVQDTSFLWSPTGHGLHLDRARFDAALAAAAERAGALVLRRTTTGPPRRTDSGRWKLSVTTPRACLLVEADAIVDATGRAGWLGRRLGARRQEEDALCAVAVRLRSHDAAAEVDVGGWALIEATRTGWWWTAPLPDRDVAAIFMTDLDLYAESRHRAEHFWSERLLDAPATRARLAHFKLATAPRIHRATSAWTQLRAGDGWLPVGDAALSFDPISQKGIPFALRSGALAAGALHESLLGDRQVAQRYLSTLYGEFGRYLATRQARYAIESRWPDAPFWDRRRTTRSTAPHTSDRRSPAGGIHRST